MKTRASLLLCGALPALAALAAERSPWYEVTPDGPGEAALRQAIGATTSSFDGPAGRAQALLRVSEQNPGTAASGLARLAAGLLLLDTGKAADAIAPLRHPDIARTTLADRASLALAQALDQTKDLAGAAQAALASADTRSDGPATCRALLAAADALHHATQYDKERDTLKRAEASCDKERPQALVALGRAYESLGASRDAAAAYDQLDSQFPTSNETREAAPRLRLLQAFVAPASPESRAARDLKKGLLLLEAGRSSEAAAVLRAVPTARLSTGEVDMLKARLGRAFLQSGRPREAELSLQSVPKGSAYEAEAAYQLARLFERRSHKPDPYESVATRFPGTEWAEEALLALANFYQKDARDEEALPYYRRLLEGYPEGRYYERASWRVGWGDYRAARYEEAAQEMEKAARQRPRANVTPGLLYWSGSARRQLGQAERARELFEETYRRYKHAYHGIRAREALAQLPQGPFVPTDLAESDASAERAPLPAATALRLRQLLLIDRLDEALEELQAVKSSPFVQATIARLEFRRGRLRPAIIAMKRAYPEYIGEKGDALDPEVWRILYPLEYGDVLRAKATQAGLDPALVAALICQESTFDAGAVSVAGARGLMQIMPPTGRTLARSMGVAYDRSLLHKPEASLDFGTHYLRELVDQFGGRVERALAAYNAGPHRVIAWTAGRPDMPAEEFVESIPFTETRFYVMTILATQEQYRRLYPLSADTRVAGGQ